MIIGVLQSTAVKKKLSRKAEKSYVKLKANIYIYTEQKDTDLTRKITLNQTES